MGTWERTGRSSWRSIQLASGIGEAPGADPTLGVDLSRHWALMPSFRAPAGQTFDGTGLFRAWVWVQARLLWIPAPQMDDDATMLAGLFEAALPPVVVRLDSVRFMFVPDGVGLSGGTDVTTDYTLGLGRP